jgi:hypothetical protein
MSFNLHHEMTSVRRMGISGHTGFLLSIANSLDPTPMIQTDRHTKEAPVDHHDDRLFEGEDSVAVPGLWSWSHVSAP